MAQNILIVSHRRSGTHLLIDTLVNNFNIGKSTKLGYRSLDFLCNNTHNSKLIRDFACNLDGEAPIIIKAHCEHNFRAFYKPNGDVLDVVEEVVNSSKIIYVYREPKDVLVSLYNYINDDLPSTVSTISEFLRTINPYHAFSYAGDKNYTDYWSYHIKSWVDKEVLFVSFEELMENYERTVLKLQGFLGIKSFIEPVDVRGKFKEDWRGHLTAVKPWKGEIGSFKTVLSKIDEEFVDDRTLQAYLEIQNKSSIK